LAAPARVGGLNAHRPLWRCPRCEHQFVTANIWHSCSRHSLDEAFDRSTQEPREAFERYVEIVARCGPIDVIAQKTRIVIMARVRFAGATVLRDRVRLNIALTRRVEAPWVEKIESYGPRWIAHRFVARSAADVDAISELPALACEGYQDLGMQESLRLTGR
jgi:Holliday junction resolvase-like predicted endonuclease